MKHVILRNTQLKGWEYGMLRALEQTIVNITGATVIDLPLVNQGVKNRFQHGMRWAPARRFLAKEKLHIDADVLWCILMGPENYTLDLISGWQEVPKKILYLFDTLPGQYSLIKKLFSGSEFTHRITSFNEAAPNLEKLTGRKWEVIEQAASAALFKPAPFEQKLIHFSSYGRRYPVLHKAVLKFSNENKLYYDFTTHDGKHPNATAEDLYNQYAWHMNHSLFTFSWPVEFTNPSRAGHQHPITCRWFEAACSGTVVIGKKPANPAFDSYFPHGFVHNFEPDESEHKTLTQLNELWDNREMLFNKANAFAQTSTQMNWENRVQRILKLI